MSVKFHLPDFTRHFRFNLAFLDLYEKHREYFRDGVEIASVFGAFPPALWNGGRIQPGICEKDFIKLCVKKFNEKGIPLRFTFTNPEIEKSHLSDNFCNMIMSIANNGMNECIVVSPVLETYIRNNYPKYKLTSSTCKRLTDIDALKAELEKDYHIVVLDYDLNNRFDILESLPNKEKCEILVNACCNPECSHRVSHYKIIGLEQIAYAENIRKYSDKIPFDAEGFVKSHPEYDYEFHCKCEQRNLFDVKKLRTHITPDDIWNKYVPMGFSQFKIEGRSYETFNLMEHYLYYMIKPECKEEARLRFLLNMRDNGTVTVAKY